MEQDTRCSCTLSPTALRHGEGNPLACACGMRGPSPYGSQRDVLCPTVARGLSPAMVQSKRKTPVAQRPWTFFETIDAWPYSKLIPV